MNVPMFADYDRYKAKLMQIKEEIDSTLEIKIVPCHNDPLCENWVLSQGRMYLIDWEYAGMNDGMWDLADLSIEAALEPGQDEALLRAYFGAMPTQAEYERFLANKLYLDFLWTLWGKARVPFDGEEMEQYAAGRYERLKTNLKHFMGMMRND